MKELVEKNCLSRFRTHEQAHAATVVLTIQNRLAALSSAFKDTLHDRRAALQRAKERREKFAGWAQSVPTMTEGEGLMFDFVSVCELMMRSTLAETSAILIGSVTGHQETAIDIPTQFEASVLTTRNNYAEQRARETEAIEVIIEEIGDSFRQLAVMVADQGEKLERIEDYVDFPVSGVFGWSVSYAYHERCVRRVKTLTGPMTRLRSTATQYCPIKHFS